MKSLQCGQKGEPAHLAALRHRDKGVSTLIAMMALVLVFMLAMTYSFFLIQSTNQYALTVMEETEFKTQQSDEILLATTIITHNINVSNPTALPITIAQIWNSNHYQNLTSPVVVLPFSNTNNGTGIFSNSPIPNLISNDGYFSLITQRGNIFYSVPGVNATRNSTSLGGHWGVTFWASNSSTYILGSATWYQLSFSKSYDNSSWGVMNLQKFGFNASSLVLPQKNLISVYVGLFNLNEINASKVIVSLNSTSSYQNTWTMLSSGMVYFNNLNTSELYAINVQYSTNATTSYPKIITIEVINADFFQYNNTPSKWTPTVTTYLNDFNVLPGQNTFDDVTVTGDGFTIPTGTIEFQCNDTGSWVPFNTTTLDINGNATSSFFTRTLVGHYFFRALYNGDSNYTSAQSPYEQLLVGSIPTVTTSLNATIINLGDYVKDNVTVANASGPIPTGTVQFQYKYENGAWINHGAPVTLSGSGFAESLEFRPNNTGTWYFQAIYSGDITYLDAISVLTTKETLMVKATPTVNTLLNTSVPIKLGAAIHDTATVTGLGGLFPVPTGTVTFWVKLPNGTTVQLDTKNLSGGQAVSSDFTPLVKGTYYFNATYSGDGSYNNAVNTGTEKLIVTASFGNTIMGSSTEDIGDIIRGSNFTLTAGDAYANSTTVALYCSKSRTVTVNTAIYNANNGALVASTTAQSLSLTTTITWFTFNFSTPPLLANNTLYRLVVWASPPSGATVGVAYVAGGAGAYKSQTYGAFPNPLNGMTADTNSYSIYCTIT
jgi:hypothetical protein